MKIICRSALNNLSLIYFDGFANLVQIKTPAEEGQVVKNLFYDRLFRVKEEQNPYFNNFNTNLTNPSNSINKTKYNYDSLSRIIQVTNPDGTTKTTTYNKNTIKDFDENNNFKTYYLDSYDRIIAVEEHNTDFYIKDNETYNTTYSYNGADELTGIRDNEGNNFNFTYNSLGQKIQLDDPDLGTWKYEYDFAGNLILQVGGGGNLVTGDGYYREYNGLNQLMKVRLGNTSTSPLLEEYLWHPVEERIVVKRVYYTGVYNYTVYYPTKEFVRIVNSSGTFDEKYVYQGNVLVAQIDTDGNKQFIHSDHEGSNTLVTDINGNVLDNTFYSPYGEIISGGTVSRFDYEGKEFDSLTDRLDFGFRQIDPKIPIRVRKVYNI